MNAPTRCRNAKKIADYPRMNRASGLQQIVGATGYHQINGTNCYTQASQYNTNINYRQGATAAFVPDNYVNNVPGRANVTTHSTHNVNNTGAGFNCNEQGNTSIGNESMHVAAGSIRSGSPSEHQDLGSANYLGSDDMGSEQLSDGNQMVDVDDQLDSSDNATDMQQPVNTKDNLKRNATYWTESMSNRKQDDNAEATSDPMGRAAEQNAANNRASNADSSDYTHYDARAHSVQPYCNGTPFETCALTAMCLPANTVNYHRCIRLLVPAESKVDFTANSFQFTREVENKYGVTVNVAMPDLTQSEGLPNLPEYVVDLHPTCPGLKAAVTEVIQHLPSARCDTKICNNICYEAKLLLLMQDVQLLNSNKEAHLEHVRKMVSAHVATETCPDSTEMVCTMVGQAGYVAEAIMYIMSVIKELPQPAAWPMYDARKHTQGNSYGYPATGYTLQPSLCAVNDCETIQNLYHADRRPVLRLLLPARDAKRVIGPAGEIVTALCKNHQAKIAVLSAPRTNGAECVLFVKAARASIHGLMRELLPRLSSHKRCSAEWCRNYRVIIHMLLPAQYIGNIIGHQGANVTRLMERNRTVVRAFKVCCPSSEEQVVYITGSIENVIRTVYDIYAILDTVGPLEHFRMYNPWNANELTAVNYGGYWEGMPEDKSIKCWDYTCCLSYVNSVKDVKITSNTPKQSICAQNLGAWTSSPQRTAATAVHLQATSTSRQAPASPRLPSVMNQKTASKTNEPVMHKSTIYTYRAATDKKTTGVHVESLDKMGTSAHSQVQPAENEEKSTCAQVLSAGNPALNTLISDRLSAADDSGSALENIPTPSDDHMKEPENTPAPADDNVKEPENTPAPADDIVMEPENTPAPADDNVMEPENTPTLADEAFEQNQTVPSKIDDLVTISRESSINNPQAAKEDSTSSITSSNEPEAQ